MEDDFKKVLTVALDQARIEHKNLPLERLYAFYLVLQRWQRSLNLTAIREMKDVVHRHFCESLFLVNMIEKRNGSLFDFGSGNGFPAIPIKIALPELAVTMIEGRRKKCHFLRAAVRELTLDKVRIMNRRLEHLSELESDARHDYFTMRAVGNIKTILAELPSIMRSGGKAFIYAGQKTIPELDELARKLSAQKDDLLLPGRMASYVSILKLP